MSFVQINWNPDKAAMRKFGLTLLAAFAATAGLLYWRGYGAFSAVMSALGIIIWVVSVAGGRTAQIVYKVWMGMAFIIGSVMSYLMLAVVYYGLVVPTSLAMRLTGRDRLRLRIKGADTYWYDMPNRAVNRSHERQF